MKKAIKFSLILLGLLFFFPVFSEMGKAPLEYYKYYGPVDERRYVFHFSPPIDNFPQSYEILSVYQSDDYLLFDVDEIESDSLGSKDNKHCFFKGVIPKEDVERIKEHSKVIFSINDISSYNLTEPGIPLPAPLPYQEGPGEPGIPLPAPLPYQEGPGEPGIPLPAPLPYQEGPGEPGIPLPAPLPYQEGPGEPGIPLPAPLPYQEGPGEPGIPLPAPLPYYINPYGEYIISHKNQEGVIKKVVRFTPTTEINWSDDVTFVFEKHFHRLEKTCD